MSDLKIKNINSGNDGKYRHRHIGPTKMEISKPIYNNHNHSHTSVKTETMSKFMKTVYYVFCVIAILAFIFGIMALTGYINYNNIPLSAIGSRGLDGQVLATDKNGQLFWTYEEDGKIFEPVNKNDTVTVNGICTYPEDGDDIRVTNVSIKDNGDIDGAGIINAGSVVSSSYVTSNLGFKIGNNSLSVTDFNRIAPNTPGLVSGNKFLLASPDKDLRDIRNLDITGKLTLTGESKIVSPGFEGNLITNSITYTHTDTTDTTDTTTTIHDYLEKTGIDKAKIKISKVDIDGHINSYAGILYTSDGGFKHYKQSSDTNDYSSNNNCSLTNQYIRKVGTSGDVFNLDLSNVVGNQSSTYNDKFWLTTKNHGHPTSEVRFTFTDEGHLIVPDTLFSSKIEGNSITSRSGTENIFLGIEGQNLVKFSKTTGTTSTAHTGILSFPQYNSDGTDNDPDSNGGYAIRAWNKIFSKIGLEGNLFTNNITYNTNDTTTAVHDYLSKNINITDIAKIKISKVDIDGNTNSYAGILYTNDVGLNNINKVPMLIILMKILQINT